SRNRRSDRASRRPMGARAMTTPPLPPGFVLETDSRHPVPPPPGFELEPSSADELGSPDQGIMAGLKRTGWNVLSRLPGVGLADLIFSEGPLDRIAGALGAEESLEDFRGVVDAPPVQVRPPQDLGASIMEHYD